VLALSAAVALGATACATGNGGQATGSLNTGGTGPGTADRITPDRRRPAPRIQGHLLDGRRFDSAAHRGTILVYNVWASWCVPCRAEAPALRQVALDTAERGVRFIGINLKDNRANARAFERRYKIPYPSVVDDDGQVVLAFQGTLPINAIPATVVVDRHGRIAAHIIGQLTHSQFSGLVRAVLAEDPRQAPTHPSV
jgi:thiol-disulfide isomerase/thioredoxin